MKNIITKQNIIRLVGGIILISLPWWAPLFTMQLTIRGLYLSILAMSFILLAGYGDMMSLAQMSFATMAGYVVGIGVMKYGLSHGVLVPLSLIGGVLLSALFGLIAIRAQKIYFLMMTLALSQLFYGVGMTWASMTGGTDGYTGISRPVIWGISLGDSIPLYLLTLFCTILSYVLLKRLIQSPFGWALQGIRDNPKRMAALGFNVQLHRYLTIVISGFFASLAGLLTVYFTGVVLPDRAHLPSSILVVMAALIGGVTVLKGGLLGGVLMAFIISITSQYTFRYWTVVGTLFILVVMFLPNGLIGSDDKVKRMIELAFQKIKSKVLQLRKE